MKLSLAHIGHAMQAVGDYENSQDLIASGIQTDSRLVQPGDLFVCISGQRFDGHNFAREAVHKGALGVVVERPLLDLSTEVPMFLVHDSMQALTDLAAYWRRQFQGRVIGVTGTAGKTSVKEMVAAILQQRGAVGKNYKNFNNQLGLSLSILAMNGREDYWVLEAGVSEKKEMEVLADVLIPDLAVIVNVGPAHLQGLDSVAGVAREKAKLVQAVPDGGAAVFSLDYPELTQVIFGREDISGCSFSLHPEGKADLYLDHEDKDAAGDYRLAIKGQEARIELCLPKGRSWIKENVLAAVSVAWYLGVPASEIQNGMNQVKLPEHRGQILTCGGLTILDDCYNANPLSMRWALDWAREKAGSGDLVLILGEMKELGDQAEASHWDLGTWAAETGAGHVVYFGGHEQSVCQGFEQAGGGALHLVQSEEQFARLWPQLNVHSAVILVKGSRGCALERFVQLIQQEYRA